MTLDASSVPFEKNFRKSLKKYLPRTLFGRSLLILVMPLFLVQLITVTVFFDRHWETTTRLLASNIAGSIGAIVENPLPLRSPEFYHHHYHMEVVITDSPHLKPMGWWSKLSGDDNLQEILEKNLSYPVRSSIDQNMINIEVDKEGHVYHFQMDKKRLYVKTTFILFMWSLGSSILFLFIASVFMRNQVRPLKQLAWLAEQFGKGRELGKFKTSGALEVRQVGAAFNQMNDRLKRQLNQRAEFLAGVSHDLRTPLARMELQLAMLQDKNAADELKTDVHEMGRMIEGYLSFVRGEGEEETAMIHLRTLMGEIQHALSKIFKTQELTVHIPDDLTLLGRPLALRRVFMNLLENAGRFGTLLHVTGKRHGSALEITIDDNGPGIPKGLRQDALKPFQRLDASRNQDSGGVGLGLAIAQDIILAHGGRLQLQDSPLGGLRVRIRLPL